MKLPFNIATAFLLVQFAAWDSVSALEPDASKMFKALEPSVVLISDAEGGGSGIVLSEDGLILTNFHVANTPLPQTVEAMIEEGARVGDATAAKPRRRDDA